MTRQALLLPPSPLFKLLSKWSTAVSTRCCHPFQRTGNYQIPKFLKHSKCRLPLRVCGLLFAVGSLTLPCVHYAYISIVLCASSHKIRQFYPICWAIFWVFCYEYSFQNMSLMIKVEVTNEVSSEFRTPVVFSTDFMDTFAHQQVFQNFFPASWR